MKKNTINIIRRYLDAEHIPYALLIDGSWGTGKTWFLKNRFESLFKKKIIYTSANGINSLDDISQQVLYRKLFLKSKLVKDPRAKLAWGITKQVGKALIEKATGYNTDDAKKLGVDLNDFASLSKDEVLIIDDIERMHKNISTEELLGYISTNFTEENKFKVILVADEAQLIKKLDKSKESYLNIKEKTIWQTVQYQVDIPLIYDALIKPYNANTKSLLSAKKEYLLSLFEKYKITNLRWILYYFQIIEDIIKSDKEFLSHKKREILLNSILITCIEYKKGNLTSRQDEEIPKYIQIKHPVIRISGDLFSFGEQGFEKEEEPKEHSKEEIFSNEYLNSKEPDYQYFESIYKLTCFGLLDFSQLKKEIKTYEKSIRKREDWQVTVDSLTNLLHLEEDKFIEEWEKMIAYLNDDKYDIYDLRNIAGLHHTYARVGITFPTSPTDLYKTLMRKTKASSQRKQYREDKYFHIRDEFEDESIKYKDLMTQSQKIESDFVLNNIKDAIKDTIEKVKTCQIINPSEISTLILNSDKKTVKLLAETAVRNNKTINNFESPFNKSVNTLRAAAHDNEKAKNNLAYFIKSMENKTKRENILKFIVKRMRKTVEEKAFKYWNYHT